MTDTQKIWTALRWMFVAVALIVLSCRIRRRADRGAQQNGQMNSWELIEDDGSDRFP